MSREKWQKEGAADRLTVWLASPAIATLGQARGLLRQVAEDVCPKDVEEALIRKKAFIDQDPQCISPNQTVGFTLRFRDPILNRAAALAAIRCEWEFQDPTFGTPQEPSWLARRVRALKRWTGIGTNDKEPEPGNQPPKDGTSVQAPVLERGWQVHRYFEPTVASQRICVRFFHDGDPISVADPDTAYSREIVLQTQEHANADNERVRRFAFQILQMLAVLLVPLVTLAMTTAGEPSSGQWWDLIGLGFGSEAIRNIVTGDQK